MTEQKVYLMLVLMLQNGHACANSPNKDPLCSFIASAALKGQQTNIYLEQAVKGNQSLCLEMGFSGVLI